MGKLKRLPHSQATREKIAKAKRGVPRSQETRDKIAASAHKRRHSPETIAKISTARRKRAAMTDADIAEECRIRNRDAKWVHRDVELAQWKLDMMACARLKRWDVLEDVKQSFGTNWARTLRGIPGVSDGYCRKQGKVIWDHQQQIEKPCDVSGSQSSSD